MTTLSQPQPASGIIPAGADHVDVYIKALNDFDSDEESVFLKVTTAYSTQGLAAGKPFDIGKTGDDFVLIKDAGWAVKSVEWVTNPYGNDLFGTWTGRSVYADRNTPPDPNDPNNVNHRYVTVIVTVEGILPVNGGMVTLQGLDPPNASYPSVNNDNNGDSLYIVNDTLVFTNQIRTQSTPAKVGINAGDNYIVEATAHNGKPNNNVKSEILTVWRRLWMELDQMAAPTEGDGPNQFDLATKYTPGALGDRGDITKNQWMDGTPNSAPANEPNNFDVKFQPPKPDISVLTSAMVDACITVKEVDQSPANASWIIGDSETQNPGVWDMTTPFVKNLPGTVDWHTDSKLQEISELSRDVYYMAPSFWCLQGIGAYEFQTNNSMMLQMMQNMVMPVLVPEFFWF